MLQCKVQYYKSCRDLHTEVLIFHSYSHLKQIFLTVYKWSISFHLLEPLYNHQTATPILVVRNQLKIKEVPLQSSPQVTHTSCWRAGCGILLSSVFSCPGTWHTVFRLNNRRLNRNKSLSIAAEFV